MILTQNKNPVVEGKLLVESTLKELRDYGFELKPIEWIAFKYNLSHLAFKRQAFNNPKIGGAIVSGEVDRWESEESKFNKCKSSFIQNKTIEIEGNKVLIDLPKMGLINDVWKTFQKNFEKLSLVYRLKRYDDKLLDQIEEHIGINLRQVIIERSDSKLGLNPTGDLRPRKEYTALALPTAKKALKEIESKIPNGRVTT